MSLICDSNQHHAHYKEQFGCKVLYDGIDEETIKSQNELRFGTDGKMNYQSQALNDYMDFMNQYGNKHATIQDKQIQADIAKPIAQKMLEDNHFYKNSLE